MEKDRHFPLEHIKYGFRWGPMTVERVISDPEWGVVVRISTPHRALEIRASPAGRKLVATPMPVYEIPDDSPEEESEGNG